MSLVDDSKHKETNKYTVRDVSRENECANRGISDADGRTHRETMWRQKGGRQDKMEGHPAHGTDGRRDKGKQWRDRRGDKGKRWRDS